MKLGLIGVVLACSPAKEPDLRYLTPRATLGTLFDAWGIAALSGEDVRARQARGRGFHLSDPAAFRGCFVGWEERDDEALAGYVFGVLAPAKDVLRIVPGADRTLVFAPDASPVVLRPSAEGWKIALPESVPAGVRRRIEEAAQDLDEGGD